MTFEEAMGLKARGSVAGKICQRILEFPECESKQDALEIVTYGIRSSTEEIGEEKRAIRFDLNFDFGAICVKCQLELRA